MAGNVQTNLRRRSSRVETTCLTAGDVPAITPELSSRSPGKRDSATQAASVTQGWSANAKRDGPSGVALLNASLTADQ